MEIFSGSISSRPSSRLVALDFFFMFIGCWLFLEDSGLGSDPLIGLEGQTAFITNLV